VAYRAELSALFQEHQYHPLTGALAPLAQIPIFMSMFFGLQHMGSFFPDWSSGGAYWFINLSAPDPTYVLPVAAGASMLLLVEVGTDLRSMAAESPQKARLFKNFMRLLAFVSVPFTSQLPQGLFLYWIPSNLFSIAQGVVVKIEPVRRALGIPDMPPPASPP
ncbi:unnamed protein product, partial [Phaeothamnion confervicola]